MSLLGSREMPRAVIKALDAADVGMASHWGRARAARAAMRGFCLMLLQVWACSRSCFPAAL